MLNQTDYAKLVLFFGIGTIILSVGVAWASPPAFMLEDGSMAYRTCSDVQQIVFRDPGGVDTAIVTSGDAVDGLHDTFYSFIYGQYAVNQTGQTAFAADLEDSIGTILGTGIFSATPTTAPTLITDQGFDSALRDFHNICINETGKIAYSASSDAGQAVYRYTPGQAVEALLTPGMAVDDSTTVEEVCCRMEITNNGTVLGKAKALDDLGQALYLMDGPATRTQVARTGMTVSPGTFENFNQSRLNESAQVMFKCSADSLNQLVFWDGADYTQIAVSGEDDGTGAIFSDFPSHFAFNDAGHAVFKACYENIDDASGIYFWDGSVTHKIVQTGDCIAGDVLENLKPFLILHNNDMVAFMSCSKEDQCEDSGIYTWTAETGIHELIRVGRSYGGGIVTHVQGTLSPGQMNSQGYVVAKICIDGDTENPIYTAVPEPAAICLFVFGVLVLACGRRLRVCRA